VAVAETGADLRKLTSVSVGPAADDGTSGGLHLLPPPDLSAGRAFEATPRSRYERYVKPVIDRLGGLVLLVLFVPLMMAICLVLRISLGRGVIYKQTRVGRYGRPFTMYKFRTMEADRRKAAVPFPSIDRRVCHKRVDDPRHTPVGRFLRKMRADELPQLWNVVRGDMSLVGPRPELVTIVDRYEPWQHRRHDVKPGITGPWQVSRQANGLAYQGVHLDLEYLSRVSFRTDFRVLASTVTNLISGAGR
jgi:lipopolysaccharide/colanic/teichoic acid biosynthesis glycosyltransferase